MDLNEQQGKEVLVRLGLGVPDSVVIHLHDPKTKSRDWGCNELVIKSQLTAGKRGKAGGIILTTPDSLAAGIHQLLGQALIIGGRAKKIPSVLVEEKVRIESELFAALVLNRKRDGLTLLLSQLGGMEVEKSAEAVSVIGIKRGRKSEVRLISERMKDWSLGCYPKWQVVRLALKVFRLFLAVGALALEINPLALCGNQLLAIDAKMSLDECSTSSPAKNKVGRHQASYVPVAGKGIGCVVNGAGLAMMTVDSIVRRGSTSLNFLDLGGKASVRTVQQSMGKVGRHGKATGALVNILGGIVSCAVIVRGLLNLMRRGTNLLPTAVRLEGTDDCQGRDLLLSSGVKTLLPVVSFSSAIQKAISQVADAN